MKSLAHYRWRMLFLAFLTAFSVHLSLFSYSPLVSKIITELKITHVQAGSIFSICVLALVLLRIPWGILIDRMGFVWVMRTAATLMGVFGLLRGFAIDYNTLMAFQLLLGVGLGATMPSLSKLVATWFEKETRGLVTGVYVSGFSLGGMFAFISTPRILEITGGWRLVFRIQGVWMLVLALLWWILTLGYKRRGGEPTSFSGRDLITMFKVKEIWVLAGLLIIAMGTYDTLSTWLPYILTFKGISPETAGAIALMMPLGFLLASLTVGTLSDRIGLRRPFIVALGLVSGVGVFGISVSPHNLLWLVAFLAGFCTVGILTLILEIPTELPEVAGLEGSAIGLISSLGNIGPLLFPIVVGHIKDVTGSFSLAIIVLSIITEMIPVLGILIRETGRAGS